MIEKNREIYSIGTICRLKNGKKYIMITGFFPLAKNEESKQTMYDYCGCMYPEGVVSSDLNLVFNHDQIEEVIYPGFVNEEDSLFKNKLNKFLSTGKMNFEDVVTTLEENNISVNNNLQNISDVGQENTKLQNQEQVQQMMHSVNVENNSVGLFNTLPNMSGNNE